MRGSGRIFYPTGSVCKAAVLVAANEGGAASSTTRCRSEAGPEGFCWEHHHGAEPPPTPFKIMVKFNVKEGSGLWQELVAAGVHVAKREETRHSQLNAGRANEEAFRYGEAFGNRLQKPGRELTADTGIQVFGKNQNQVPKNLDVSGLIPELQAAGYVVVGYHLLVLPGKPGQGQTPPKFVIELGWGGKPEEWCDWEKVSPIAAKLWVGSSFTVHLWVNPPTLYDGRLKSSHTVNIKERSNVPARYILRWDSGNWGLESVVQEA